MDRMKMMIWLLLFILNSSWAVLSIAHRGAPFFEPENTLVSFKKAIELKSDYLEIDVRQTQDEHWVVLHDSSLERTTDGQGEVSNFKLSEVLKLKAGKKHRIPQLLDVFSLIEEFPHAKLIIELKSGDEKNLTNLINSRKLCPKIILKSFDLNMVERFKELAPECERLYVFVTTFPTFNITIDSFLRFSNPFKVDAQYLQWHHKLMKYGFINQAHHYGKKLIVWGVDDESSMKSWINHGVDGIETDRLDIFNKLVGR
jgi:glycerophosphoryl diester phosphodiesterase